MKLWTLELLKLVVMLGGAVVVQQLIRRHGRDYAAEVFHDTRRAGPAFVALADIAYYLLVVAYVLFNLRLEDGGDVVTGYDMQAAVYSVGGLALIIGLLHAFNILVLPAVGRMLARRLDLEEPTAEA